MTKTTEKTSLINQLKALPGQVKIFILGSFIVLLALASILPNLNSKSLQGNVLNAKTESKVSGYGYGYGYQNIYLGNLGNNCVLKESGNEKKISCYKYPQYSQEFYNAYSYAVQNFLVDSADLYDTDLLGEANFGEIVHALNQFAINNGKPGFGLEKFNGLHVNQKAPRSFLIKYLVLTMWPANYANDEAIFAKAKSEGMIVSTNPDHLNQPQTRGLAYLMLKKADDIYIDICKTQENILACTLGLDLCPVQCRPATCQTQEAILACSLGLESCPFGCNYGSGAGTGVVVKDVAITSASFTRVSKYQAKVQLNVKNIGNVKMLIGGVGFDVSSESGETIQITLETVSHMANSLNPGEETRYIGTITATGSVGLPSRSVLYADVSTQEQDQNMANNKVNIVLKNASEITSEEDQTLELKTETNLEEVKTEEVQTEKANDSEEKSTSLLDMLKNIVE